MRVIRVHFGKGDDEVGLKHLNLVEIDTEKSADPWFAPRGWRFKGKAGDADNPAAGAERINDFNASALKQIIRDG